MARNCLRFNCGMNSAGHCWRCDDQSTSTGTRETWAVIPATFPSDWWLVQRGGVNVAAARDQVTAERIMRFLND